MARFSGGDDINLIGTLIIGLIVGALAKLIMPGKDPGGIIITIIIGIAGAFLGTFLGQAMHLYQPGQSAGWIMSIIGALILLAIYRVIKGRSA
ncbi:putative membrane protein [Terriglobus roseus DSM 18391]|uniref:Putative membrane protein n=1 Tax=Terriglobus roseus (strain DSM 18391 / NRRL B-41598 / KBS 63) TaxID=926566 RepID=I3ZMD9_TERRK|nr:putative membrane protein [Terriglobus roseus DSM 18391]